MYSWNDGTDVLAHHGILGQKWGVRRFQNPDGSLTAEGRRRYGFETSGQTKKEFQNARNEYRKLRNDTINSSLRNKNVSTSKLADLREAKMKSNEAYKKYKESEDYSRNKKAEQRVWKDARRESIRNRGAGEQVVGFMLMGPVGLYNYNSLRTTGSSIVSAGAQAMALQWTTGGIGNMAYSTFIGDREKRNY